MSNQIFRHEVREEIAAIIAEAARRAMLDSGGDMAMAQLAVYAPIVAKERNEADV